MRVPATLPCRGGSQDDISLLRVMSESELRKQRSKGIFTVTQLSYTFRPRRKGKRAKGEGQPHHAALQALAIRDAKTYVLGKPEVPDRPTQVYLDLEGDANAASVYLLGALVVKGGAETMHSFWADGPSDEERLLRQLLEVVEARTSPSSTSAATRGSFLRRMRRSAKRKGPVDRLLANAVDVLSLIRSNVYFPVYANGLKEIGRHLGFAWTDPDASGLQSLVWRRRWEQTRDDILQGAARRLQRRGLCGPPADHRTPRSDRGELRSAVRRIGSGQPWAGRAGEGEQAGVGLPEVGAHRLPAAGVRAGQQVCLVRLPEGEGGRPKDEPEGHAPARPQKEGQAAEADEAGRGAEQPLPRVQGPERLQVQEAQSTAKLVFDLKVSEGGVRRVVIKYVAAKYHCQDCGRYFLPKKYKRLRRFGHALKCWAMYQHIANRTSFQNLETDLQGVLRPDDRLQRPVPIQERAGTPLQGDLRRHPQEDRRRQPPPRRRDRGAVQAGQGLRLGLHQPGERGLHVQADQGDGLPGPAAEGFRACWSPTSTRATTRCRARSRNAWST